MSSVMTNNDVISTAICNFFHDVNIDQTLLDYISSLLMDERCVSESEWIEVLEPFLDQISEEAGARCAEFVRYLLTIKLITTDSEDESLLQDQIPISSSDEQEQEEEEEEESNFLLSSVNISKRSKKNEQQKLRQREMILSHAEKSFVHREPTTIQEFMEDTYSKDPRVRKKCLTKMCPCRVKADVDAFWTRIIEMVNDPDPSVRYQVLHNLCDGSPKSREEEVMKTVEKLNYDEDSYIRRRCHQVIASYRKTGKWNIM